MPAMSYWYLRVRQSATGAEIQRISTAGGATTDAEAVHEMTRYLASIGRAGDGDDAWEIKEVARWR